MGVCHSSTIISWQVCYIAHAESCLKSQDTEVSIRIGECWIFRWKDALPLFWSLAPRIRWWHASTMPQSP